MPEDTSAATPKQVRIIRRQLNITQRALADYLGVSEECVKCWETDKGKQKHRAIPFDKFLRIKELHTRIFE